jgi:anti-anti-sigma factor
VQPAELQFRARSVLVDNVRVVFLRGDVDAYTAPILREALAREVGDALPLTLDCSGLTFIDGAGLKVLEWAAAAYAPRRIEVRNAPPALRQLTAILGFRLLDFVPEAGAAVPSAAGAYSPPPLPRAGNS